MKVYSGNGFRIEVYSRDHEPVHCHVYFQDKYHFKVLMKGGLRVSLIDNTEIPTSDIIHRALKLVKEHKKTIGKTWRNFHGN